ncbi:MAG: bifunctional phosphopantothenoylcysteine decarboxylase/phosphopantothenate--cysteine ligase CoaBC [Anaeromicrobium sp.]|jgi:phosphopantothenoylcysteine decarboxylase/phosphopantothenate--cysteine ligase|uniref:bifunctional phosphopantothenoylcysteine decarboxylase/phosphopantothenate--cysteine ligase CoaBC n=1 Tax=Anaeromicrobium sp. TaxID=1929132 RepID=UPI0025FFBBBB|nr:bifunctional phosphopantothenoylcysteine decarboxylase/phosphopantothenate--cysteine ligase CoaBC [Anaeromicrobium sp.]MCT4595910.1 bifunctional phosphopantothenoylcysteine decarboxylase/phosphopantothenate--cysteine ligase CoaBC [Anaeromicrobium sp.]
MKNIVLGVTGGIAVYKACDIVSRLKKKGYNVDVIMTKSATEFVTPLTFRSLSQNYVVTDMFHEPKSWDIEHIALAKKADLFLLAPATANIIGKMANGIADDMLSTTIMATRAKILIAPAMNTNMYENVVVQENMEKLKRLGYDFVDPAEGRLACGDLGKGKLADPEVIVNEAIKLLEEKQDLKGKNILITAGPTREPIDPVRYITNHSSGKMGYAIAQRAAKRGANVVLISGPTNLDKPKGVEFISIETADHMYKEVTSRFNWANIIIKSAAVADYRPKDVSHRKIKKSNDELAIALERNHDILKELGRLNRDNNKILIGFAAETNDLVDNAKSKLNKKNVDMIVANDLTKKGAGFEKDTNIVTILEKNGKITEYGEMKKIHLADIILDKGIEISEGRL